MRTRSIPLLTGGALSTLLVLTTATSSALATDEVVVAHGDTLSAIAVQHGLTVDRLAAINGLDDPNRIYVGQRLSLEAPVAATPAAPAPTPATAPRTHVVSRGEHLTGIARRYGTTIAALVALNRITDPSFIRTGTRLAVPGTAATPAAPAPTPATAPRTHVVSRGEHLTGIARRYGTTIAALVALNRITDPSFIRTGTRLAVPGTAAPVAAAPAPTAPPQLPASMAALVARRADVGAVIAEMAQHHGVPVAFAKAVAWQESGWQHGVTSHAGAIGVMQLMPATADWVAGAMLHEAPRPADLRWNVSAGVRLLRHYLDRYHGDRALVLAAYYQGQRAVDRHGIYRVSRPYIASILVLERIFGG